MNRNRRPPMRRAAQAGDLLESLLVGWGIDGRLQQYRALLIWDEVVGPQIAARTRPEKIRDGVLEVCVDQPTWMQQLHLLKPTILDKLNSRLGANALREIFLKRGRVSPRAGTTHREKSSSWKTVTLPAEEVVRLREMLSGLNDEELRLELEQLLLRQIRLARARQVL